MAKKNSVKENVKKTSEEEKLQELESGVNAEELENASEKDIKKALTESISFTGTQKEITEKIDFAAFAICNHYDYIISRKSGQKIPKIANLQYYKSKAIYGTKKKSIFR